MSPNTPPMSVEIATRTVPTAFVPVPLGAFSTACSSVTRRVSRWCSISHV